MRIRKELRQEAVDEVSPVVGYVGADGGILVVGEPEYVGEPETFALTVEMEEPKVFSDFVPEKHVVILNPEESAEGFGSGDSAIIYHKTEADYHPLPMFNVGDRFKSLLGTGLKLELKEHAEYVEERGWKVQVQVLDRGDNDHLRKGQVTKTDERNLAENFELISEAPAQPTEKRKAGRPKKSEEKVEEPNTPKIELPTVFNKPWGDWPFPDLSGGALQDFRVSATPNEALVLVSEQTGEVLGDVSITAIEELGKRTQFPPEFVGKLSPSLAAQVITERIKKAKEENVQIIFEDGRWCGIVPTWRGILPTKQSAQLVYDLLRSWYPEIEVVHAEHENGVAKLRLLTPVVYPVTQTANDALRLGVDITHQYGDTIRVSLYTRRIASGGGLLSHTQEYSWRKRTGDAGSANAQAAWLIETVTNCVCGFTTFIERAVMMSNTRLIGDTTKTIKERASAMGITKGKTSLLLESCRGETTETEWDWSCRLSKYASLVEKEPEVSRKIMSALGRYIENFQPGQEFSSVVGVSEEDE